MKSHTSHVTRHTSHVTRHTSHITRHADVHQPRAKQDAAYEICQCEQYLIGEVEGGASFVDGEVEEQVAAVGEGVGV